MNRYEEIFRSLHFYCMRWGHGEPVYEDVMTTFDGASFYDCIEKYHSIVNYEELRHWVIMLLRSRYHFKAEYEMQCCDTVSSDELYKFDIWDQVAPNVDVIVDMINSAFELGYEKTPPKKPTPLTISFGDE